MACYHPLIAYRGLNSQIVFNLRDSVIKQPIKLPCGQCIGCRLEYSRQWALRCMHESQLYIKNSFVTLTYSAEHLPSNQSLDKSHFQKFIKRLRKSEKHKIRYYHCGEYGEQFSRPHYHALLFNHDFDDKILYKDNLYTSQKLTNLWPFGFSTIGPVNFETCAYTARYILKKINGQKAETHYIRVDENTGECYQLQKEYCTMSRRPGIGSTFYKKYKSDLYPSDFITSRGIKMQPPKFYDKQYKFEHPLEFDELCTARVKRHDKANNTPRRLYVREQCAISKSNLTKRTYHE